ncbi:MAG: glucose-1-phosphate cytidylyltransferase [Pseudomonadota bacterium]|nr:glucose-1-phosphate cytidylyltransferase [Pseudomonadota bacterium]
MKAVILAGGRGTRIAEERNPAPKPMVTIGDRPILWHIMKIYAAHGVDEFVICLGYRGYVIKEYFANFALHSAQAVTFDYRDGSLVYEQAGAEPWKVTLVETGLDTQTGGRLKRIRPWVEGEDAFCMTYGDGVSDVDISASIDFHRSHGRAATVTAVAPAGRFGVLEVDGDRVSDFTEKPSGDGTLINGGFFVLSPGVIDRIADDATIWERAPLQGLARDGELQAFHHEGFWQPMDTMRERDMLDGMWRRGEAPWKIW